MNCCDEMFMMVSLFCPVRFNVLARTQHSESPMAFFITANGGLSILATVVVEVEVVVTALVVSVVVVVPRRHHWQRRSRGPTRVADGARWKITRRRTLGRCRRPKKV